MVIGDTVGERFRWSSSKLTRLADEQDGVDDDDDKFIAEAEEEDFIS